MRLKRLLLLLPLLLVPLEAPAIAQNVQVGMPIKISRLPACTYQRIGVGFYVYDAASASDCSTGGGTGNSVLCSCNGAGTWIATSAVNTGISYAGDITIAASGTLKDVAITATSDITLSPVVNFVVDVAGGTDELAATSGVVAIAAATSVTGAFKLVGSAAPPVACAAGTEGTVYLDSTIHKLCVCNGTNYVLVNDDSTTTGCS